MNLSTFVMTNIVPQSKECNRGAWEQLEQHCRYLVNQQGKKLYIVAGPHGIRGEGENGWTDYVPKAKVIVPNQVWKVIMVLDGNGKDDDVDRVDRDTRLIAVIMPNDTTVPKDDWWDYRKSVKEVEELTGFTFFDKVPVNVIEPLKMKNNTEDIPVLEHHH